MDNGRDVFCAPVQTRAGARKSPSASRIIPNDFRWKNTEERERESLKAPKASGLGGPAWPWRTRLALVTTMARGARAPTPIPSHLK